MSREVLLAIWIVFGILLLILLPVGWYGRTRRQKSLDAPRRRPESLGTLLGTFPGKYVATTAAENRLDRIAAHGLGFPSNAVVTATAAGLLVERDGEDDLWIPAADLRAVDRATWTIGRAVERDGLQVVEWMLGSRPVATYLRLDDPLGFESALTTTIDTERQGS